MRLNEQFLPVLSLHLVCDCVTNIACSQMHMRHLICDITSVLSKMDIHALLSSSAIFLIVLCLRSICGCTFGLAYTEEFWEHTSKLIISLLLTIILCFCTFANISGEFYLDILIFLVNILPSSIHKTSRLMRYLCGRVTIDLNYEVLYVNGTLHRCEYFRLWLINFTQYAK